MLRCRQKRDSRSCLFRLAAQWRMWFRMAVQAARADFRWKAQDWTVDDHERDQAQIVACYPEVMPREDLERIELKLGWSGSATRAV